MFKAIRNLIRRFIKLFNREEEKEEGFITIEEVIPKETKRKLYRIVR